MPRPDPADLARDLAADVAPAATPAAARADAGTLRSTRLALALARHHAARSRQRSSGLRAHAVRVAQAAAATREFTERHRLTWEGWHRTWAALVASGAPRLLRVCAYCGKVALERTDPETAGAWGPVPSWVRDGLRVGTVGVRPTHGVCPTCAVAWLERE